MMSAFRKPARVLTVLLLVPAAALATEPKLDALSCTELRLEHLKSVELGLYADIQRGPEWAKANLTAERLRDLELFIQLDEQVKFGCRDAKLTLDAERAGEAAKRLELNPDLDPTLPLPPEVPVTAGPGSGAAAAGADAPPVELPAFGVPADELPKLKTKVKRKPKAETEVKPSQNADPVKKPQAADAYVPSPGATTLDPPLTVTPLSP
jgi:hypothetical protein